MAPRCAGNSNLMKTAIIIVTYNSENLLSELFTSLERMEFPTGETEMIVVDNGSGDETFAWLKNHASASPCSISLLRNDKNLGFATANNQGISEALKNGHDFVALLNQDVVVTPNWLVELLGIAMANDDVGAVQPLILLHDEPFKINTTGNPIHFLGFGFCGDYLKELDRLIFSNVVEIGFASGAAMLLSVRALREVGLFDERLFLYYGDLDLGWRLRLCGFRNVLAPRAVVFHRYHYRLNQEKFYLLERNRWLVIAKNYEWKTFLALVPAFLLMELGISMYALCFGYLSEKWRGYYAFVLQLPQTLAKRKMIQSQRRVTDRQIARHFTDTIPLGQWLPVGVARVLNAPFVCYWAMVRLFAWSKFRVWKRETTHAAIRAEVVKTFDLNRVHKGYFFENDMLIQLNLGRYRVKDLPIPACYGAEKSDIDLAKVAFTFPVLLTRRLLFRLYWKYLRPARQST